MSNDIPEDYGFEHVVVRDSVGRSQSTSFHLADPDEPGEPRCSQTLNKPDSGWQRADPDDLPWRFSLCRRCNPDIDADPELDFSDPDGLGDMTAHQIRQAVREGELEAVGGER